tara:strand:+ start:871 stop:972 length:102 start_codon:yes stop_codon:yes gene_type:complete
LAAKPPITKSGLPEAIKKSIAAPAIPPMTWAIT